LHWLCWLLLLLLLLLLLALDLSPLNTHIEYASILTA
jgi:hypothetical protein